MSITTKSNLVLVLSCLFLISCASTQSAENAGAEGEPQIPIADLSITPDQEAAPGATSEALAEGQASGDLPSELPPAQVPPGVEQVVVDEKPPELTPVAPASSWTAKSAAASKPSYPSSTYYGAEPKKSAKNISKRAAALKAKKAAAAAKKNKKVAKKLSKAECKKFAKNPKKHKKQIAQCKIEKKKTASKAKKSRKIARG